MPNYNATGRPPSKDPRKNYITVKMTDTEKEKLEATARILSMTKTSVIVAGVERMYTEAAAQEWKRTQGTERKGDE